MLVRLLVMVLMMVLMMVVHIEDVTSDGRGPSYWWCNVVHIIDLHGDVHVLLWLVMWMDMRVVLMRKVVVAVVRWKVTMSMRMIMLGGCVSTVHALTGTRVG